jgi:large repetitive protein
VNAHVTRQRRSRMVTSLGTAVVTAVLATIAIVSPGFEVQQLELDDGSVWIANGEQRAIGRANTQISSLDTVVQSEGADLHIVQSGTDVVVVDQSQATAEIIDTARAEVIESVPLPTARSTLAIAGDSAVVHSSQSGGLWILSRSLLSDFDATSAAPWGLGPGSAVAFDDRYGVAAVSSTREEVVRIDPRRSDSAVALWPIELASDETLQITIAASQWVVLEPDSRRLHTAAGVVDVSELIPPDAEITLAAPHSPSPRVLVAHSGGLISVPLDGGAPSILADGRDGVPAQPVIVGECAFAAWSDGVAWRECAGETAVLPLLAMPPSSSLAFAVRDERVLLNDRASGAAWAVQEGAQLIDNWDELLRDEQDAQEAAIDELDTPPQRELTQRPPVAVDDDLGARPGRSTSLPVLLNDSDPNGDALVIDRVDPIDPAVGRVDIVGNGQFIQLSLEPASSGEVVFGYSVTDGRGGESSAIVRVSIRAPGENGAPVQVRTSKTLVVQGGTVTASSLGDWVDPDGDAMYVVSATMPAPDSVSSRPDGRVTIQEEGGSGELRRVALVVSDGTEFGTGEITVTVQEAGQTPIIADPFAVLAYAGQEVSLEPLRHVRGGTGPVRISAVQPASGALVVQSLDLGVIRFTSDEVRTHYLEYVVTDGDQTTSGVARIDVLAPPAAGTAPIAIPKTAFVRTLSSSTVAVATTDIDPAGGVLVVTGVSDSDQLGGVRPEIIEQRDIRVTLTRPLTAPVDVGYVISNGSAQATGTITVIEIPPVERLQPPIARDDSIVVRVGDAVTIPVMLNDEHPDDEAITLAPDLLRGLEGDSGLLFVSGDSLRYLAPGIPGEFTAVYEIVGPLGVDRAQATVQISVREVEESTNAAPAPRPAIARVIAGESVRIRIPVESMDPDGDSVQVIGQEQPPEKGTVVETGPDYIDYQAGVYSSGTDTFSYTVVDSLGARATGVVRVGISQRLDGAVNPVANDDEVTVRTGVNVIVPVLRNDTDPTGSPLEVTAVESTDPLIAAEVVDGETVRIAAPESDGRFGFVYTIQNGLGGVSQAFISLVVRADAPLTPPVARDTVLTLSDILGVETVDVDVRAGMFFSEGDVTDVALGLVAGYDDGARVLPDGRIEVEVREKRQIIPFVARHPDDPLVRAYAFIWVPGTDDALPQLDRRAPRIEVESEQSVTIDINDYVLSAGANGVRITDRSTVRATNANGDPLVVDSDTLRFTSADRYFGPASLSFEVTDGLSASDRDGRVATIVLPITVTPRENQPPVMLGATLDLEPGQERTLDLVRITAYPYPDDLDELAFSVISSPESGVFGRVEGQRLILRVDESAVKGSTAAITLGVGDSAGPGTSGRIVVRVVPSTRPLARPADDVAIAPRGTSTTVDVLANDAAGNPFPASPLRVVAIRGLNGVAPSGVTFAPADGGQSIRVSVSASAAASDTNLQYQVADSTNDPDRYVWARVRISVQDVPDPVTDLRVQTYGNRTLDIAWAPGSANNAPITGFRATVTRASDGSAVATVSCAFSPCTVPTPGNGPDNRVRVSVVAVNAQGASAATTLGEPAWSDIAPPAPALIGALPLDRGLRVGWSKPAQTASGSPIRAYRVSVGSVVRQLTVRATDAVGTVYWLNVTDSSLENGTSYPVSVSGRNDSQDPLIGWISASGTGIPAGPPQLVGSPKATASTSGTGNSGNSATVSWAGTFTPNGRAVQSYYVWVGESGSAPACTVQGVDEGAPRHTVPQNVRTLSGDTTSVVIDSLMANREYRFVVYAFNGQGCTASSEVRATPRSAPGTVTSIDASAPQPNGEGRWDIQLRSVTTSTGPAGSVRYRLVIDGAPASDSALVTVPTFLTAANGAHYGRALGVQVQACERYETLLCSEWSAVFPIGTAVRIDARPVFTTADPPPGEEPSPEPTAPGSPSPPPPSSSEVTITWNPVSGSAYTAVKSVCLGGTVTRLDLSVATCTLTVSGSSTASLQITVTVGAVNYVRTYRP